MHACPFGEVMYEPPGWCEMSLGPPQAARCQCCCCLPVALPQPSQFLLA